jgi:hypothetical protein
LASNEESNEWRQSDRDVLNRHSSDIKYLRRDFERAERASDDKWRDHREAHRDDDEAFKALVARLEKLERDRVFVLGGLFVIQVIGTLLVKWLWH